MNQLGIVLVVSVSIFKDEEVLIIKENKPTAINKWNFPSGRMEYGEDILEAARREVKEETGLDVKLTSSTGVYNFYSSTNNQVILFHFIAEQSGGSIKLEEDEIVECKWVKPGDLLNYELRELHVLEQIINNIKQKKFLPISLFNAMIERVNFK
ncbi:NUDIX hydrolase [Cytobacillus purgationiresistens]|uniref:8-oxo-dGTP pyrophosphatase MutT (NUDIX family) n=1 Tax=Cytobacillus purgationiresistens TaxID=863449 RepID=A0ABU0AJI4_9BACI|nr:NUDIX domain-containing protein [Cytobacillus purgationiresistens]MDQ0271424.1 8-oxo-dGTP pyrophosphatase MutT (NUDIX family) [Cytobacillus purgationiresistens]